MPVRERVFDQHRLAALEHPLDDRPAHRLARPLELVAAPVADDLEVQAAAPLQHQEPPFGSQAGERVLHDRVEHPVVVVELQ